jgi:hypothetical protein
VIWSLVASNDQTLVYQTGESPCDRKPAANGSQPGQQTGRIFDTGVVFESFFCREKKPQRGKDDENLFFCRYD